ncbi:MAG: DNA polymerase-3 subunit epsilon [Rhodothermales bacterium]|jgi:DNA polymerase-3 subunit epsilon
MRKTISNMLAARAARRLEMSRAIDDLTFSVIDCEMTGLSPSKDELISIAGVHVRGAAIQINERFDHMVCPASFELADDNAVIHRLSHSRVEDGDDPAQVMAGLDDFLAGTVLVGHCVNCDIGFINPLRQACDMTPLDTPVIDTLGIWQWYQLRLDRHRPVERIPSRLQDIVESYDIPSFPAHDALGDVLTTACVLIKLLAEVHHAGLSTLGDLMRIGRPL